LSFIYQANLKVSNKIAKWTNIRLIFPIFECVYFFI
jgi:hypothetical protein